MFGDLGHDIANKRRGRVSLAGTKLLCRCAVTGVDDGWLWSEVSVERQTPPATLSTETSK